MKSIFTFPQDGTVVRAGSSIELRGFAWAGEADITRVDVSTDFGRTWTAASLDPEKDEKLALCRQLLGMPAFDPERAPGDQPADYDYNHVVEQLRSSLGKCPVCQQGRMIVLEVLAPVASAPLIDTS